jgi:hypothetical protein
VTIAVWWFDACWAIVIFMVAKVQVGKRARGRSHQGRPFERLPFCEAVLPKPNYLIQKRLFCDEVALSIQQQQPPPAHFKNTGVWGSPAKMSPTGQDFRFQIYTALGRVGDFRYSPSPIRNLEIRSNT